MQRMKRFVKRGPSAAMVVAVVALIAALGGTAIAGGGFLSKKKFKHYRHHVAAKRAVTRSQINRVAAQLNALNAASVKGPIRYATKADSIPVTPAKPVQLTADCPKGTRVLGGGATISVDDNQAFINDSGPTGQTGWTAHFDNLTADSYTATVTAICATAP